MNEIYWIKTNPTIALAIVMRPRGDDWLVDELLRLKKSGIDTLVSMLEMEEASSLGLAEEQQQAEQIGMDFVSYPIADRSLPLDSVRFRQFVTDLANRLQRGKRTGIHCRASIGRAAMAAAGTLIRLGWSTDAALMAIENARGCPVPDTEEQREWILRFGATL